MIGYNNEAPKAVNNVGQFGATEGTIGAYKSAAEYAADAKYWALLSQTKYSSVEDFLAEVERLYAQGLLLKEDIEQLKTDFETQQQELLGLIQSTGTAIDDTNAATELSKEATQEVLAQLDIISNMTVQTTLLPPGSMATGSYDNTTGVFSFGIPEGQPGRDGTDGSISDISDVAIGVPVSDDYGFYVDKENGGLYRATMSDIANLIPSISSISINGGEEQTGAVSFNSVSSFNSRTGDVVSEVGDYSVEQITGAAKSGANSDITSLSGLTTALSVSQGGTGASTPEASRTNLGLGSVSVEDIVPLIKGGTGATTPSAARTNLGLGLVSTESIVPITKGGTGSTSAENARLALVAAKSGANSDITSMTNSVTFTQPVSVADAVDATNAVNLGQISSDQGASLIGTLEGVPVQNIISNINTDIIQLKLKWAIENGYSDAGFTFTTGGTLTANDRDKVVYDPVSKTWYSYAGTLPVTVPAGFNPVGNADWKPQTDPYLRDDLSAANGGTIIGTVSSMAMFYGLAPIGDGNVYLNSWYEGADTGGGYFYYDATMPTANHDGGIIISPSVPYTSDANSADYVSGVGETNPSGFGCWVRRGVTEVTGAMYGMSRNPDSNIDLAPHFNKAIAYAGKNALGFKFPGNVVNFKSPVSIPMHQRAGGKVAYIRGVDEKSSVVNILSTATSSSNYGIYFDGSLSTFSAFPVENLTIKSVDSSGNRADWSGFGILFTKCIRLTMRNVLIDGFEIGCKLTDSLYLKFDNCRFIYNKTAIQGRLGEVSGPNAVGLYRCDFQYNAAYCIDNQHAHAWKIDSCAFEANGGKSYANSTPIAFNSCVQFALIGGAGANAAHFDNCYFENNNAGMDISFYVNRNFNQIMNVSSCIFNHNSDKELASRILVHSNLSAMSEGLQVILNMDGNGFYNIGSTSTAYRNVQFAVPSTFGNSHIVFNDSGNKYSIPSPFSGMKKVQIIGPSQPAARAVVSANGVGSFLRNIASTSKTGVGKYEITFIGGIANSMVLVTIGGGSGRYATVEKSSDYAVTVYTFNNSDARADLEFNLLVV